MACSEGTTNFIIQNGPADGIIANSENINVCNATKILEHLHKSFTEQYVASAIWTGGQTPISIDVSNNPTFWLRSQPTLAGFNTFNGLTGSTLEQLGGQTTNRLYEILFKQLDESNQGYRSAIHAIMTGQYNNSVSQTEYLNVPTYPSTLASPKENFKGLYGLIHANNLLEAAIVEKVSNLRQGNTTSRTQTDTISYNQRKNIKTTMEEIAYQENKIYREKFLNLILMVIGIFIVGSQLAQVFSPGGGGGGGGDGGGGLGFGGVGGWLSTRFGSGSGGLFSRFGGLGLGSSGRSRVGNLFTSSPYSLSKRE
jgi:hypothetical protein